MITDDDLNWWLELAPTLDWVFATTYAKSAPHEYIVEGKTDGLSKDDFVRAGRVIRTYGQPGKFYNSTNIYLESPDGWKWWTMDKDVRDTNLVNRAHADHVYGPQNAPQTDSGTTSAYDALATSWDAEHGPTPDERAAVVSAYRQLVGPRQVRVLDIGCGTGLTLDLDLTDPVRYTGVDPSRGMLNELVVKYPYTAALHALSFQDALDQRVFGGTRYDFVVGLRDVISHITPEQLQRARQLSKGPMLFEHVDSLGIACAPDADSQFGTENLELCIAAADEYGGTVAQGDGWTITAWKE